jgi:hypothetical protein
MTENEALVVIRLARGAIESELFNKSLPTIDMLPSNFKDNGAVFVTLKNRSDNSLRGCIGSLIAHRPLYDDIISNAVSSAFNDPRFEPLKADELAKIKIEISLLTEPRKLHYEGTTDLLSKITPNSDGLIIKFEDRQATFLPSVWEEIQDIEQFLSLLCRKAGLTADFYKSGDLDVYLYKAMKFEEN